MRALEYTPTDPMREANLNLEDLIGQQSYNAPSVFNFYLPDYQPPGAVSRHSLVAPEAQLGTAPYVVGDLLQRSHLGVRQVGLGLLRGNAPGGFPHQAREMQAPRLNSSLGQLHVGIDNSAACIALSRYPQRPSQAGLGLTASRRGLPAVVPVRKLQCWGGRP